MGFLFKKPANNKAPEFTGLQIQTSVNTMPIPIIYGTPRVTVNLIYYEDFKAVAVKSSSSGKSGGKGLLGGGGKGGDSGTFTYSATLLLAVGEGPLTQEPLIVFQDQGLYLLSALPNDGILTFFSGTAGQAPWSFFDTNHTADARPYAYTCYLAGENYPLDSTATVPQFNLLIPGHFQGTCPLYRATYTIANQNAPAAPAAQTVALDIDMSADPASVVFDYLTNKQYGLIGFAPANLPDLPSVNGIQTFIDPSIFSTANAANLSIGDSCFQTYCQAAGFGFDIVLNTTEQASSVIERWAQLLGVAVCWTGTTLKFIPYWDTSTQANPGYDSGNEAGIPLKYFVPDTTPLFSLTDDDFVREKDQDPVTYERIDTADIFNAVRLDFKDRTNLWNSNFAEAKIENDIEIYGDRTESLSSADEFSCMEFAGNSAQVIVQNSVAIRNIYTFKLSWEFCILEEMDVVDITDTKLGLNAFPVRIVEIGEDDKMELTIKAKEFKAGAQSAVIYPKQPSSSGVFNTNFSSNSVNPPFIFEPTSQQITAQGGGNPSVSIGLSASAPAQVLTVGAADLGTTTGTSFSGTFTVSSGLYRIIVVGIVGDVGGGNDDLTSVQCAGVNMTLIAKSVNAAQNRYSYLYFLVNPASGSNTISVACTNSHLLAVSALELNGARQSNQPDASGTNVSSGAASSLTTSVTTIADKSLVVLFEEGFNASNPPAASTGDTRRAFDATNGRWGLFDSTSVVHPAGSHAMTTTRTAATNRIAHIAASFAPATPLDPNFGGANVYISNDNVTYALQGRFSGVSTMGYTTAAWPASASQPDNVNDLKVDLTESDGQLITVTDAQAQGGASLCAVFNGSELELVAYVTATLTAANQYTLHGLYRGLYGTEPITAAAGSQFMFLGDGNFFNKELPPQFVGQTLYFKFTTFNTFNSTGQDLSAVTVYQYIPGGSGSGPSGSPGFPVYTIRVITTNTNITL